MKVRSYETSNLFADFGFYSILMRAAVSRKLSYCGTVPSMRQKVLVIHGRTVLSLIHFYHTGDGQKPKK